MKVGTTIEPNGLRKNQDPFSGTILKQRSKGQTKPLKQSPTIKYNPQLLHTTIEGDLTNKTTIEGYLTKTQLLNTTHNKYRTVSNKCQTNAHKSLWFLRPLISILSDFVQIGIPYSDCLGAPAKKENCTILITSPWTVSINGFLFALGFFSQAREITKPVFKPGHFMETRIATISSFNSLSNNSFYHCPIFHGPPGDDDDQ